MPQNFEQNKIHKPLEISSIASIHYFEFDDGRLTKLELLPIQLGVGLPRYRIGDPVFAPDRGIIERYADMSLPYGTKITVNEDGTGCVELD